MNISTFLDYCLNNQVMLSVDNNQLKVNAPKDVLQLEQVNFIKENKSKIIEILSGLELQNEKSVMFSQPVDDGTIISKGQRQMWLLDQVTSGQPYCFFRILRLDGRLDFKALNEAFAVLIHRHKQLRTTYQETDGVIASVCLDDYSFAVESSVIHTNSNGQAALDTLIANFQAHEFDLASDVMLKAHVASKGDTEHYLFIKCHHIATDGWSLELINQELNVIYSALESEKTYSLPSLQHEYGHFSQWQNYYLNHNAADIDRAFWSTYLSDVCESLNLSNATKTDNTSLIAETVQVPVDKMLVAELKKMCGKHNMTMYTLFQFAFSILLARYSQQQDVLIGTPVANRDDAPLQSLVGYFVNTLPIRFQVDGQESFGDSIKRYQDMLSEVMEHKDLPLNDIVNAASLSAELMTQVMFTYSAFESSVTTLGNMAIDIIEPAHQKTDLELHLNCIENNGEVICQWHYANTLYDNGFIVGIANHFVTMLQGLVDIESTKAPLSQIAVLSEGEVHHLIYDLNNTVKEYPKTDCIHELFESQVDATPDKTALVFEGQRLTYRQLNEKSNQLAHYLVEHHHVKPDTLIGLCVERSLEMVIGIFAILKAGGAYVPLDPSYPQERLSYMCEDTALQFILSQSHTHNALSNFTGVNITIDNLGSTDESFCSHCSKSDLGTGTLNSSNLAYVIYTSGSTGHPKGVMVEHQAVVAFLSSPIYVDKALSSKVASLSSYAFDGFVYDLFYSLTSSAELHIYPQDLVLDVERFKLQIQKDEIENFFTTTALFNLLAENQVLSGTHIKQVLFGGERSDPRLVETFKAHHPDISLMHVYGPTEAIVYATTCDLSEHNGATPIGRPLNHNTVLVLSDEGELVPFGSIGDLHIGGDSLARGYLNHHDLTHERFIENPYYDASNIKSVKRLYRTGDLVRYLPDGNIEFVGRADDQVKIRGFRIELGEIEAQLSLSNFVDSAYVMAHTIAQSAQLVGYVKSKEKLDIAGQQDLALQIKTELSAKLPDYMVPTAIIVVSEWPLTPNGKIDKKTLPSADSHLSVMTYQAPENNIEHALVNIIASELKLEAHNVSVTNGFYELGGHSLLALKIQSKLKEVGYFLSISDILLPISLHALAGKVRHDDELVDSFVPPKNIIEPSEGSITVEQLNMVEFTESQLTQLITKIPGGVSNISDIYSLSPLQEGMLFHHIMDKEEDLYLSSFTLQLSNKEVLERFFNAMNVLVNRHDTLRTVFFWEGLPEPTQVVMKECEIAITHRTLDAYGSIEAGRAQLEHYRESRICLHDGPLLKLQVGKCEEKAEYIVLVEHHHLIIDHIGLDILVEELTAIMGQQSEPLLSPTPYRNIVAYAKMKNSENQGVTYFQDKLAGLEDKTELFSSKIEGDEQTFSKNVKPSTATMLRNVSKRIGQNVSSILHTAWSLVASQCTNNTDIAFGTVLSGRLNNYASSQRTMGMAINTLPLRVSVAGRNVKDVVEQVSVNLQELIEVEQTPLSSVLNLTPLGSGLFNSVLNYRHSHEMQGENEIISGCNILGAQERNNYAVFINIDDYDASGGFNISIQTANGTSAEKLHDYFTHALNGLLLSLEAEQNVPLTAISILPENEVEHLTHTLNETHSDYAKDMCIHELFEEQVRANPSHIAVVFEGIEFTYNELNEKANQLAHALVTDYQVTPDTLIGLSVERSLEMVVGVLAILKAGGAYVPLDPSYPLERLKFMVEDADVHLILTQSAFSALHREFSAQVIEIDDLCTAQASANSIFGHLPVNNLNRKAQALTSNHLAYVIYTSGSTGKPKGVLVEHRGVVNYLCHAKKYWQPEHKGAVVSSPLSFDATVTSLLTPLVSGKELVVLPEDMLRTFELLSWYLFEQGDSWMFKITPTHLDGLFPFFTNETPCLHAHSIVIGGEQLTTAIVNKWQGECLPNATYINEYGPTETVVGCTTYSVSDVRDLAQCSASVLIGRPINNTQLYVLNNGIQAPLGVIGELCIAGDGVTRGYLNRADLTEEKFTTFTTESGKSERIYRSGDMVRYISDGNLEFICRADDQVKIRGFRIEIGEVEAQLAQLEWVDSAFAMMQYVDGQPLLSGYVKLHSHMQGDALTDDYASQIKSALMQRLPDYMVPNAIVIVDEWPLTPNGKVDKKALPEPQGSAHEGIYTAPETDTEKALVAIWAELLNLEMSKISTTASFFDLGGHSLLMVRLFSHIQSEFGLSLDLKVLYDTPYIKELAQLCDVIITKQQLKERLTQRVESEMEEVEF
ncbi:non-ribosomal peptide synthetase [Pseudoalteromonas sp. MMG012]|uniref:non-ribosomal peptide synthetase n=1 Tax=Pseudoalteromonas sp. MMG012 TaxID=2822686 RepID=UPI001B3A16CC|nr:non-ribosomal peptide synthetase [Pseudoalteromonas sp. MMG012]MBQ4850305.1 amino acid adenylation domain-containing protein [Pseudoalteromonas sp. MMG012]